MGRGRLLDALPERVNRYRVSDLAITYCNAAWASQYDVEPADAIGRRSTGSCPTTSWWGCYSQLGLLGPHNPILVTLSPAPPPTPPVSGRKRVDRYVIGPRRPRGAVGVAT